MNRKLVFWTCFNSFRNPNFFLRPIREGEPHPTTTLEWTIKRVALFKNYNIYFIFE